MTFCGTEELSYCSIEFSKCCKMRILLSCSPGCVFSSRELGVSANVGITYRSDEMHIICARLMLWVTWIVVFGQASCS